MGGGVAFDGNTLKLDCGNDCKTLNILNATGLHTLNRQILEFLKYISIKLFFKKRKEPESAQDQR